MPSAVATNNNFDAINPNHYKSRSVECIEFTRHLPFSLANVFKYAWRYGAKDVLEQEEGKIGWYCRDAIVFQPKSLIDREREMMVRRLTVMRSEFEQKTWDLLMAVVFAASGDYSLLLQFVEEAKVLSDEAHEVMFA